MSAPKVDVVILNYNNVEDTRACLNSLRHVQYDNLIVRVVDNGSTGSDADIVEESFGEWVDVIRSPENLGYSEGNNLGIHSSLSAGADYVLILNNDVEVSADFLDHLIATIESDPSIGMVGPTQFFMDRPDTVFSAGANISVILGLIRARATGKTRSPDSGPTDVDMLIGACLLVRRAVFETVGLLPTEYFLQWEDADFSTAVRRAGFRVVHVPDSTIWHRVNATLADPLKNPERRYAVLERGFRNRMIYFGKYMGNAQFALFALWQVVVMLPVWAVYHVIKYREPGRIRYMARGLREGLRATRGIRS